MTFSSYLQDHLNTHPAATGQDILKFCYQAAKGPEHLTVDPVAARQRLEQEWKASPVTSEPLVTPLSDRFCRVHLGAWKKAGLPGEWLLRLFLCSAEPVSSADEMLAEYLSAACALVSDPAFDALVSDYQADSPYPLHHSETYRKAHRPAYRVIRRDLLRLMPILRHLVDHPTSSEPTVIAIDGRAASGKSTVAAQLSKVLDAAVVHMDDFFLPPTLRTPERLAASGGNVHYERFAEQVLPFLRTKTPFSYRRFDCSVMRETESVAVPAAPYHSRRAGKAHFSPQRRDTGRAVPDALDPHGGSLF